METNRPDYTLEWGAPTHREVMSRSRATFRSRIYSAIEDRLISCESLLESRTLQTIALSLLARTIREQYLKVSVVGSGSTIVDFYVITASGRKFAVEVKPAAKLHDEAILRKMKKTAEALAREEIEYVVATEQNLPNIHPLNLKTLTKYITYSESELQCCKQTIESETYRTVGEVVANFNWAKANTLLANKFLHADLSEPVTLTTKLSKASKEHENFLTECWRPFLSEWEGDSRTERH